MSLYKGLVLFTLPMYYAFHTRYQGMTGVFAWLVKYFLPCFFVAFASDTFSWSLFALGLIYVYQFYELGYIQAARNMMEMIKKPFEDMDMMSECPPIVQEIIDKCNNNASNQNENN